MRFLCMNVSKERSDNLEAEPCTLAVDLSSPEVFPYFTHGRFQTIVHSPWLRGLAELGQSKSLPPSPPEIRYFLQQRT
jgi:hypothetical protein